MKRVATLTIVVVSLVFSTGCLRHTPQSRLEKAHQAWQKQDFISAYLEFDTFLEDYPEDENAPLAARYRAACLFRQRNFDGAAKEYEAMLERYPESTDQVVIATVELATCKLYLGDATSAIEIARPLLESETLSEMAYGDTLVKLKVARFLGDCYISLRQPEKALEYYKRYREDAVFPFDRTEAGHSIASTYLQSGSYEQAIQVFNELLDATTTMPHKIPEFRYALAQAHAAAGQFDQSLEVYDEILSTTNLPGPHRKQIEINKADVLVGKKDYKTATELIKGVINDPSGIDAESVPHLYMRLAEIYAADGQTDESAKTYQSLRTQFPLTIPALVGNYYEARLYKESDPANAERIFNEALVEFRRVAGATETIEALQKAVWAQWNIAWAHDQWGNKEQALAALDEGIARFSPAREAYSDPKQQQGYVAVTGNIQRYFEHAKANIEAGRPLDASSDITSPEGGIADSSTSDATAVGSLPAR